MPTHRHLLALLLSISLPTAGFAATVSPTDPAPNTYDPADGTPLSGGIGYNWTVQLGVNDQAALTGVAGAWSWDEDSFAETAKGWTHTSQWIALTLPTRSRVTIRVARQADVVDPFASVPGTIAGANLFPAFTLYAGWDEDGGDHHTYNNRGAIDWAEDVTYLTHVETNPSGVVELTVDLAAGRYSVVLGGNSPSTLAEGRQGYLATLGTSILDYPEVVSAGKKRVRTEKRRHTLTGVVSHLEAIAQVHYRVGRGKIRTAALLGDRWKAALTLEPGRNVVTVWTVATDGRVSPRQKINVTRD